jgi:pyridoxine 5-phosphate synthase
MKNKVKLGVNVDHIATIRNARGGVLPSPLAAAKICEQAGADGITVHLREDRRHIRDNDVYDIRKNVNLPLNFEMAATAEMLGIAIDVKPHSCCIVPERRAELTTEGGLDVVGNFEHLKTFNETLKKAGILVSLFIDADDAQIRAAAKSGADIIEIHTGKFCHLFDAHNIIGANAEFERIAQGAKLAQDIGLQVAAGHGLNYASAKKIVEINEIVELNIGHFIIGEAALYGLDFVVKKMKEVIER